MLQRLQRLAFSRAFAAGGRRPWLVLAASIWLLRKANEVRQPQPEVVYRGVLEPGQVLLLDHRLVDRRGKAVKRSRRR